jgi:hypothetical protein
MNKLYSVSKDVKTATSEATFIPPGIQENLTMTKVEYGTTEKNNEFLAFYFKNEFGDTLSHTEWPFRLTRPFESMSPEEKEKVLSIIESQKSRIKQIVETFIPRGTYIVEADSFKEFAEKTIELLGDSYKDEKVRVKVVLDYRNYTSLPNNPRYTFIEKMDVPKDQSKIRLLQNDKLVRTLPDKEDKIENPLEVSQTKSETSTDLPF